jgi:hypothetical protein
VVLSFAVQPVEPLVINIPRLRFGPNSLFLRTSTLGQWRRLTAWSPLIAQVLPMKVIDREPTGAALLPLSSPLAIRQFSATFWQALPTISTSKVAEWPVSNV